MSLRLEIIPREEGGHERSSACLEEGEHAQNSACLEEGEHAQSSACLSPWHDRTTVGSFSALL